jgi:hypothetical protein
LWIADEKGETGANSDDVKDEAARATGDAVAPYPL